MASATPFDPPVGAVFYALAAVAQILVAAMILARQGRREWAWIFAGLFMANAGGAFSIALRTGLFPEQEPWGSHAGLYFDQASFVLLLYLALAFPTRPRLLQRRPLVLPAAALAAIAGIFVLNALDLDWFQQPRYSLSEMNPARLLFGFLLPAAVWMLLLLRWTTLWLRPMPAGLRRQFQFIFAVFALRAGNQVVATLEVPPRPETMAGLLAAAEWSNALALLAFLAALALLAFSQSRQAGTPRGQTFFVVCFMVAGLAVGTLGLIVSPPNYFTNTFGHFDLYILRPAMVWIAVSRFSLLDAERRDGRWGLVLLWILSLALFANLAAPLSGRLPELVSPLAWTLVLGAVFATLIVLAARPWILSPPRPAEQGLGPGLEAYRAAMAEAHRNGEPGRRERRELERLREWLGISAQQHAAILEGMQGGAHPARTFMPGDIVAGRYRVERLLGEGATGEVHLAHDVLLGQRVVLKRTRKADATHRRTILREAETMARIHHPHVVRLLRTDFFANEPLLVLEWMPGGSLQGRLSGGRPLPQKEAVRIALQALAALQALHAAGIVHGDVKPGNILFAADGTAKLADFGVARAAPGLLGDPTAPAQAAGSLRYMAPETLRGARIDGRADVYAVAMVLHEMLAGHPLDARLPEAGVRQAVLQGVRPALPARLPSALRKAVSRGLAGQPARRHASAGAFAQALQAATPGTPAPSGPRPRRRRLPAAKPGPSAGAAS